MYITRHEMQSQSLDESLLEGSSNHFLKTPFNAHWLKLNDMIPNMMERAKNHNSILLMLYNRGEKWKIIKE